MKAITLLIYSILFCSCAQPSAAVSGKLLALDTASAPGLLPSHANPSGFTALNDPHGGRLLRHRGMPGMTSPVNAMRLTMKRLTTYFDGKPRVTNAVEGQSGSQLIAFFDSSLKGTPVQGLVYAEMLSENKCGVAVVFDKPTRLSRSFGRLVKRLHGGTSPTGASLHQRAVSLTRHSFPDGAGSIGLPSGWKISGWGNGGVDVMGPHTQMVDVGIVMPVWDSSQGAMPSQTMLDTPYIADPAQAYVTVLKWMFRNTGKRLSFQVMSRRQIAPPMGVGNAELILFKVTSGSETAGVLVEANCAPVPAGNEWLLSYSQMAGPWKSFQRDSQTMSKIWGSYRLNQEVAASRLRQAAESLRQANEIVMSISQHAGDASEQGFKAFDNYIRDTATIESVSTGAHGNFGRGMADLLVTSNPNEFRYVNVGEFYQSD